MADKDFLKEADDLTKWLTPEAVPYYIAVVLAEIAEQLRRIAEIQGE